jgi:hypothetical protein
MPLLFSCPFPVQRNVSGPESKVKKNTYKAFPHAKAQGTKRVPRISFLAAFASWRDILFPLTANNESPSDSPLPDSEKQSPSMVKGLYDEYSLASFEFCTIASGVTHFFLRQKKLGLGPLSSVVSPPQRKFYEVSSWRTIFSREDMSGGKSSVTVSQTRSRSISK